MSKRQRVRHWHLRRMRRNRIVVSEEFFDKLWEDWHEDKRTRPQPRTNWRKVKTSELF